MSTGNAEPDKATKATVSASYRIAAMDCAAEESEIRRALEPIEDIDSLSFQLGARTLTIVSTERSLPDAIAAIRAAGFDPQAAPTASGETGADTASSNQRNALVRPALALVLATAAEAVAFWAGNAGVPRLVILTLAAAAIALAGFETYRKGFAALLHGRLTITALMSVAVTGAFLIGQWPEAAMVMALYVIAELIEAKSLDRARNAIRGLLDLTPDQATVEQADSRWVQQAVAEVPLGAVVRIRPGERVPLDGIVTRGTSAINQAPVTGESIPVDKAVGDTVFAGTINETGELEIRVTAAANNTTLARIIHAVESAQGTRAPTQRFVDRFAAVYTPAVFALALSVALLTPWLLGWYWTHALYKALVLLVIGCPCALVISTPVTVVSALASAARRGILVKGGTYLEEARRIRVLALDKTGTITEGKPRLVATDTLHGDADDVAQDAASLAGRSDHPVSRAIAQGLKPSDREVSDFRALAGRGVQGVVGDRALVLGNHRLIEEMSLCSEGLELRLRTLEDLGRTAALLASSQRVLALYAVADTIKPSSQSAIADLHNLGVKTVMLTGDNQSTADSIARDAGIDEARGNLLPEDKLTAVRDMKQIFGFTAMTGDGINDAPALALADIGIAMGAAGTDTAIEAADVVIMNDDLRRIPDLIRLSQKTHVILSQNISLALGIKAVFLFLALFNGATMWMAVFADMGASLLVVANGLRLLRSGSAQAD